MKKNIFSLFALLFLLQNFAWGQLVEGFEKKKKFGVELSIGFKTRQLGLTELNNALSSNGFSAINQNFTMLSLEENITLKNGLILGINAAFAKFNASNSPLNIRLNPSFREIGLFLGYQIQGKHIDFIPFAGLGTSVLSLSLLDQNPSTLNSIFTMQNRSQNLRLSYAHLALGFKMNYLLRIGKDKLSPNPFSLNPCQENQNDHLTQKYIPIGLTFSYTLQSGSPMSHPQIIHPETNATATINSQISGFSVGLSVGFGQSIRKKL